MLINFKVVIVRLAFNVSYVTCSSYYRSHDLQYRSHD